MRRLLYTLGIAALIFEGYVVHTVINAPLLPQPKPMQAQMPPPERNTSYHAKNIPATPDPIFSALNKTVTYGRLQSSITWQHDFSATKDTPK